ncbi:Uma2 family endonuclease [Streptantibioticus rubrisoli]|uniref:Uma2 family endonuclease n=1 Tax=Streptantibioticus rubrisoli TaxID=1387313 RepID=A0ABT1PFI7_9ACTN|nr:Uma2 family endonuclease [Streptantibioticus rubrisoli]MCQ4044141.1 Uma2 family endonuclease [Streptantibioticus rubrisoli]
MTALAHAAPMEVPEAMPPATLDEALWQAWKSMELPEGFRAEIVEGFIEVSPTGRSRHAQTVNRLRRALERHLGDGEYAVHHDWNVIRGLKAWVPDLFIAPEDDEEFVTEDGLGFVDSAVRLVVEVVSPGYENQQRDRVRKRRAYAGAGIPVYVIVDDFDNHGTVTILTSPSPEEGIYAAESRTPYGTEVQIPEGPAKGFAIGKSITGPSRS